MLIEKCVWGGERGEGGGALVKGISRPMEQLEGHYICFTIASRLSSGVVNKHNKFCRPSFLPSLPPSCPPFLHPSIHASTQPPPSGQDERCCRVREQKPGAIKQRSQRLKVKPDGLQRAGRVDTGVTQSLNSFTPVKSRLRRAATQHTPGASRTMFTRRFCVKRDNQTHRTIRLSEDKSCNRPRNNVQFINSPPNQIHQCLCRICFRLSSSIGGSNAGSVPIFYGATISGQQAVGRAHWHLKERPVQF